MNLGNPRNLMDAAVESPDVKHSIRPGQEIPQHRNTPNHAIFRPFHKEQNAVEASPSGSHATVGTADSSGVDSGTSQDAHLPVDHITAAHRLLVWPSIQAVISKSKAASGWSADYVMNMEEKKGILRVYGRGEGQDLSDGGHPSSPSSSTASTRSDDTADMRSPSSSFDGVWGAGFKDTTPLHEVGGLGPNGHLNLLPQTLRHLLDSYLENIHILHPFLDKNLLTRMVERFSKVYNPADVDRKWTSFLFKSPSASMGLEGRREPSGQAQISGKRKHSDSHYQNSGPDPVSTPGQPVAQPPQLERSISTSIVLLVMALGKICQHKQPLPGPVPEETRETPYPHCHPYSPIPPSIQSPPGPSIRQSPASSTQSMTNTTTTSPMSGVPCGARDPSPGARNVDVIPGLAYYAHATDILGNCHGGNDLAHVQANLLAGLYAGQLARTFESWSWIHTACRACRYLVRE